MKVGDLVVDTRHNYARGVIIEKLDSNIFEGSEDIYKVYFQKESKAHYTISSNLKTIEEIRETPDEK